MLKPSETGRGSGGFTLLELLVVVAIVVLISISASVALPHLVPRQQLRADAQSLAIGLREVKAESISTNRVIELDLDTAGTLLDRHEGVAVWKPSRGVSVTGRLNVGDASRLRFYPDGSTSGGDFVLGFDQRRTTVDVSPLTGRVQVDTP
jgi:general secretion pathway protein H